jgi:hypothetical protein
VACTVWRMSPSTTASRPSTRIRGATPPRSLWAEPHEISRVVQSHGLVLKAGNRYLVARGDGRFAPTGSSTWPAMGRATSRTSTGDGTGAPRSSDSLVTVSPGCRPCWNRPPIGERRPGRTRRAGPRSKFPRVGRVGRSGRARTPEAGRGRRSPRPRGTPDGGRTCARSASRASRAAGAPRTGTPARGCAPRSARGAPRPAPWRWPGRGRPRWSSRRARASAPASRGKPRRRPG